MSNIEYKLGILIVGGGIATATSARAQASAPVTAFVNVSVIPMDTERVLTGQTVVVQGDRITALGPMNRVRIPPRAKRIEGHNEFLLPGLGDMHVHLQPSWGIPESLPPKPVVERMLTRQLATGVTTVRNMRGRPWHLTLKKQVASGELLGPRIYTSGPIIGDTRLTPAAGAAMVTAQHAFGYDFLKIYDHPINRETFDSVIAAADRLGMRYAGHVPEFGGGLRHVLQTHFASDEHLYGYIEPLITASGHEGVDSFWQNIQYADMTQIPALAAATKQAGMWNVPTLALANGFFGNPKYSEINNTLVKALSDTGAGLLLGTDDDADIAVVRELRALVVAGLTPYQALETGTRNVAVFLGTLDSTGTVAIGKRADLVLLLGNPLVDIDRMAQLTGVMVGGRWLPRELLNAKLDMLAPAVLQWECATGHRQCP